jgi:small-conductance mechanosensitive channel
MNVRDFLQFIDLDRLPLALLILVAGLVVTRLLTGFLDDLGERWSDRRLLLKKITALARFTVYLGLFGATLSSVLVLESEALLAVAGSIGVAVGFAFKDLLASLMAGIILLFDRPFQVGDRVEFGGSYGEVKEIGLRTVRLVTLDDNLVSIPNHRFLNDAVACANAGELDQMCVLDFWLGCSEDFGLAKRLVYEAAATSRYVYLAKPIHVNVREQPTGTGTDGYAIRITVKAYVLDGRYETAFGTDITERAKRAFRAAGIRTAGELLLAPRPATLG